jgi:hypothetical protein
VGRHRGVDHFDDLDGRDDFDQFADGDVVGTREG